MISRYGRDDQNILCIFIYLKQISPFNILFIVGDIHVFSKPCEKSAVTDRKKVVVVVRNELSEEA